jgi:BlaI family penicillinase repressor
MTRSALRLGKVQLQIMQVLWEREKATARQITDALSQSAPIAHSTTQTLLRQLEAKGAITHDPTERIFVFRPISQQHEIGTTAAHDLLTRVFGGSVSGLVAHLLKHERISPEERARLRELIDDAADNAGGDI